MLGPHLFLLDILLQHSGHEVGERFLSGNRDWRPLPTLSTSERGTENSQLTYTYTINYTCIHVHCNTTKFYYYIDLAALNLSQNITST